MKKYILNKDGDEILEVQGSIVLVPPYKGNQSFIGMEYFVGKKIIRKILGEYDEETAKDVFRAISFFLDEENDYVFEMPNF